MPEFLDCLHSWSEVFMRRSMHELLRFARRSGLSMSQISVLYHLHYGRQCSISDLGERLGVSNAAASQLVERLVQARLLERRADPADRRTRHLALTAQGERLIQESLHARSRWMEEMADSLDTERQQAIGISLSLLTAAALDLEGEGVSSRSRTLP